MTETPSRIQFLNALAKEPSAEKRHGLLSDLAHVFKTARNYNMREVQDYGETLARVLPSLPEGDRRYFAELIAPAEEAPSYLIRTLAFDQPAVAAPVLAMSPMLVEDDLIEAMKKGGSARLAAIAQRTNLPPRIVAILVQIGDPMTTEVLLANQAVKLPENAIVTLIGRAKKDDTLADLMLARKDIPAELLAGLFFSLSSEKRIELAAALAERESAPKANISAPSMAVDALLKAVRAGDRGAFEAVLEQQFGIAGVVAARIARDPTCEAMAVACLGLGIGRALFSTYAVLTRPDILDAPGKSQALLGLYDKYAARGAQLIASGWRSSAAVKALPSPAMRSAAAPRSPVDGAAPASAKPSAKTEAKTSRRV